MPHCSFAPTRFHRQPQFKMICSQIGQNSNIINDGELFSNVINQSPELLLLLFGASGNNQATNDEMLENEVMKAELMSKRAYSAEDLRSLQQSDNLNLNSISKEFIESKPLILGFM